MEGRTSDNTTSHNLNKVEVPDSNLLLLNGLNLRQISAMAHFSRQNSEQNTTSSRRCVCAQGVCKCCTGYLMDLINQKACMKITYSPGDFAFDVAMSMNDRVLYENSISGKFIKKSFF